MLHGDLVKLDDNNWTNASLYAEHGPTGGHVIGNLRSKDVALVIVSPTVHVRFSSQQETLVLTQTGLLGWVFVDYLRKL